MDVSITSIKRDGYLLIESTGSLDSANDLFNHSQLIHDEVIKYDEKKILINNLGTRFPKQFFSYVELVNHYVEDFPAGIKAYKIATVIPEEIKEMGSLWETIAVNRGFDYHAFTSLDDGKDWLLK